MLPSVRHWKCRTWDLKHDRGVNVAWNNRWLGILKMKAGRLRRLAQDVHMPAMA